MTRDEIINLVAKVECALFYENDKQDFRNEPLEKLQKAIQNALQCYFEETL